MKYLLLFFILISCTKKPNVEYQEKIGVVTYNIKDTTSTIIIGHCDITECLDAEKHSGNLYYPEKIFQDIKKYSLQKGEAFIPNSHDLYLKGEENLTIKLFDSILSPKMANKYIVTGKVIGFKGYGTYFKIYTYKKLADK
ncbi:hypothetical protein [Flavobacterium taihuense]|jgi:hypothetical protein|uniref:Lipoprotein n=1 Tax=Flavobacterium taihuense TaxID=2857508 RepID=A0ABS6XZJ5_9FLAO|nr:hypothetical protein [Flavobacterium taihuense]MBW4362111.1 hypothetical protein [Flavobacterium taihuense]